MKITEHPGKVYFSHYKCAGLGAEQTLAVFHTETRLLTVTYPGKRYLLRILRELEKRKLVVTNPRRLQIEWYTK